MDTEFQDWAKTELSPCAEDGNSCVKPCERAFRAGRETGEKHFVQIGVFSEDRMNGLASIRLVPFVEGDGISLVGSEPVYVARTKIHGRSIANIQHDLVNERLACADARAYAKTLEELVLELGRELEALADAGKCQSPYNKHRLLCQLQNTRLIANGFEIQGTRTGRIWAHARNESNTPKEG